MPRAAKTKEMTLAEILEFPIGKSHPENAPLLEGAEAFFRDRTKPVKDRIRALRKFDRAMGEELRRYTEADLDQAVAEIESA